MSDSARWAAKMIGEPWLPEHNCRWLVQSYFATQHNVDLPTVQAEILGNATTIREAIRSTGWAPVSGEPSADDVVTMFNPLGKRHIGVLVRVDGRLGVLHNDGCMTERGPVGCVVFQSLAETGLSGYRGHEFWRHRA